MGYEYFIDANDGQGGAYLYDQATSAFFYSSPQLFPYLYDFNHSTWLYYYPNAQKPGRYTTNPRWFYDFADQKIISL